MARFLVQRLATAVPTVIVVTFIVFLMVHLIPGDPATILAGDLATPEVVKELRTQWGLDRPLAVQYLAYMKNLVRGDLGRSIASRSPVALEIGRRYPSTLRLAVSATIVATAIGITAGVVGATKAFTGWDYASMTLALVGISTPIFWSGLILILIFSVQLGWLPAMGTGTWKHMILPAFSLGLFDAGVIARQTRSSLLEVLGQDYVRTARAKGAPERLVVIKHAMKNAIIPVITIIGIEFGRMLGGAVLTESVFSLPGIGRYLIIAINQRDYPVIQGIVLVIGLTFVLINLLVDLTYGFLDPRIRQ